MVLIIVSRDIDLSVGSLLGFLGMIMVVSQSEVLPWLAGDVPAVWLIAIIVGIVFGACWRVAGFVIAYCRFRPSSSPCRIARLARRDLPGHHGTHIAAIDPTYQWFGGGANGTIGATASWVVGVIACIGIVANIIRPRQRRQFNFPLRPIWAEVFLAVVGCGAALGAIAVINAYPMPPILARAMPRLTTFPGPTAACSSPSACRFRC